MKAIYVEELGGPEVLRLATRPDPAPQPGEVVVAISVAGVNFMDTGARRYGPAGGSVPFVPGVEAAGTVTAVGAGVDEFAVGDRVAWVYSYGSYAEQIVVPAARAVPLPDTISDATAAAIMMQGLTAQHCVAEAARIERGQVTLVHAAAGGVGQLVSQLVKLRGGTVIGLVSREDKVAAALGAGADEVIVSAGDQFTDKVLEVTNGAGVDAVFDGGGEATFAASLRVTRRHGTVLYYGALIGSAPVVNMRELPNSIKVCYPIFRDHISTRTALLDRSADLFRLLETGKLRVAVGRQYRLSEAAQAHQDIESRRTTGKLLLIP